MRRRGLLALTCAALLLGVPAPVAIATELDSPESLKAAFLFNFMQFVSFPGSLPPRLQLCTLAGSAPLPNLAEISGGARTVRGVAIEVQEQVAPRDVLRCHLVYVDHAVRAQLGSVVDTVGNRAVVIVTDFPGGVPLGATIAMVLREDGRMGFDVNRSAARNQGLELSAQLLRLARRIY